jgi:hypothetical protein
MLAQQLDRYLAEKYYNFKSYGLPHFICSPWGMVDSSDGEDESTLSHLQLKQS